MAIYNVKHGVVEFEDGSGAASRITLGPGAGDLTIDGLMENQTEEVVVEDRGEFLELVEGKQTYPSGTINLMQDGVLTDPAVRKVLDSLLKTGASSTGTTVEGGGVVWTGNLTWTGTRSGVVASISLPNCRFRCGFGEDMGGNKIPISFICYGRPTRA
jgi:hypothetical protein